MRKNIFFVSKINNPEISLFTSAKKLKGTYLSIVAVVKYVRPVSPSDPDQRKIVTHTMQYRAQLDQNGMLQFKLVPPGALNEVKTVVNYKIYRIADVAGIYSGDDSCNPVTKNAISSNATIQLSLVNHHNFLGTTIVCKRQP